MILLWWTEKQLTKSYKYIRNDYGLTTVLRLFLKRKLWYYYHGSNEQRVIEIIRLLFFIVKGVTCAIIKQINKSEFSTALRCLVWWEFLVNKRISYALSSSYSNRKASADANVRISQLCPSWALHDATIEVMYSSVR